MDLHSTERARTWTSILPEYLDRGWSCSRGRHRADDALDPVSVGGHAPTELVDALVGWDR